MSKNLLQTLLLPLLLAVAGAPLCRAQTTNPAGSFSCFDPNASGAVSTNVPRSTIPVSSIPACSRVLNVNIHYILRTDGSGNFNEVSDQTSYTLWSDKVGPLPWRVRPADTARNGYA